MKPNHRSIYLITCEYVTLLLLIFFGNRLKAQSTDKLHVDGEIFMNTQQGIKLQPADQPLITRGWDAFTTGAYSGVGRWGIFMEPSFLTFGIPNVADKGFQFVNYDDNSSIGKKLVRIQADGRVGIGTDAPTSLLHVVGGDAFFENTNFPGVAVLGVGSIVGANFAGGRIAVEGNVVETSASGDYMGLSGYVETDGNSLNYGIQGHARGGDYNYGLRGIAEGVAVTSTNIGVVGVASGPGTNYAGGFDGDVYVTGTLSKTAGSFKIDHPLDAANKYLSHSFVESPDMMNIYNGNAWADENGEALVELPDYFESLNYDFRYQLTAVGAPGPNLYISEKISANHFKIAGARAGMEISWQVTGIRQDVYAKAHPIKVEESKAPNDRGKYLHPELFGKSGKEGINYHVWKKIDKQIKKNQKPLGETIQNLGTYSEKVVNQKLAPMQSIK